MKVGRTSCTYPWRPETKISPRLSRPRSPSPIQKGIPVAGGRLGRDEREAVNEIFALFATSSDFKLLSELPDSTEDEYL